MNEQLQSSLKLDNQNGIGNIQDARNFERKYTNSNIMNISHLQSEQQVKEVKTLYPYHQEQMNVQLQKYNQGYHKKRIFFFMINEYNMNQKYEYNSTNLGYFKTLLQNIIVKYENPFQINCNLQNIQEKDQKDVKNFDDLKKETSCFLTQSYLRKGGMYLNQLNQYQQIEQENKRIRELQIKQIEEKEQIQLDVSVPIQGVEDLDYLLNGNGDSGQNQKINNILKNRDFRKSFSIVNHKPQQQETLTNFLNGDVSIKSYSPAPTLDLEFDKKKVNTEQYVADSDDNQNDTFGSIEHQLNLLEKSKPINNHLNQSGHLSKRGSNVSAHFPIRSEQQINHVSKFWMQQQNNNEVGSSDFSQQNEEYETDINDKGDIIIDKGRITKYQFKVEQPHLSMKNEQIFSKRTTSNNQSFQDRSSTYNRFNTSEHLNSDSGKKALNILQTPQYNSTSFANSKDFIDDVNYHQTQTNKEFYTQQTNHSHFQQSHQLQETSHSFTSDATSQKQNNRIQHQINKKNILSNQQNHSNMIFKPENYLCSINSPKYNDIEKIIFMDDNNNSSEKQEQISDEFLILGHKKFTQYIDQSIVFANQQFQFTTVEKPDSILKIQRMDQIWRISFLKDNNKDKLYQQSLISSIEADQNSNQQSGSGVNTTLLIKYNPQANYSQSSNNNLQDDTLEGMQTSYETGRSNNQNNSYLFYQIKKDKVLSGNEYIIENYSIKIVKMQNIENNTMTETQPNLPYKSNYQRQQSHSIQFNNFNQQNYINSQNNPNQQNNIKQPNIMNQQSNIKQSNTSQQNKMTQQTYTTQQQNINKQNTQNNTANQQNNTDKINFSQAQQNKQSFLRSQSLQCAQNNQLEEEMSNANCVYIELLVTDLNPKQKQQKNKEIKFWLKNNKKFFIGRNPNCDICLGNSTTISGRHCYIELDVDNQVYINDNQSSNGTWKKVSQIDITKESVGYHFKLDINGQEVKIVQANSKGIANEMKKGICFKCKKHEQDIILFQDEQINSLCIKCFQKLQIHDNFSIKLIS